jgi:protein-disulfide isomerase
MSSKSSNTSKAAARTAKAAELRAGQEQAEKRRRLLMIGGVAALFLLIVGGAIAVTILNQKDVDAPGAGEGEYGVTIGDADAAHEIVIYEDFLCPICGQLEAVSNDGLAKAAEDGKVLVEYRPIAILTQFGDYSVRAANAFKAVLEAAGPEEAKAFHDLLYEDQPAEDDPDSHYTDDELVDLAVEAGATEADVRDDIEGLAYEDWVEDATAAAADAHVEGTPTIVLDGELFADGGSWSEIGQNLVEAVQ